MVTFYTLDNIWFQYYIENSIGRVAYYARVIRIAMEEQGVLVWTIHIAPRWRACTGPDTDRQYIEIFYFNIPIYIAPWARDHIVHVKHIDNMMPPPFIDNSTHIATSIINISSGSIRVDGYCSEIVTFQYRIADVLGEVLIRPHRYSKHTLPSITGVTALNHSNLKKAIQYVLAKAIHLIWQYVLKVLKTIILL